VAWLFNCSVILIKFLHVLINVNWSLIQNDIVINVRGQVTFIIFIKDVLDKKNSLINDSDEIIWTLKELTSKKWKWPLSSIINVYGV